MKNMQNVRQVAERQDRLYAEERSDGLARPADVLREPKARSSMMRDARPLLLARAPHRRESLCFRQREHFLPKEPLDCAAPPDIPSILRECNAKKPDRAPSTQHRNLKLGLALPPGGREKQTGNEIPPSSALLQGLPSRAEFHRKNSPHCSSEGGAMEHADTAGTLLGKPEFKVTLFSQILPI